MAFSARSAAEMQARSCSTGSALTSAHQRKLTVGSHRRREWAGAEARPATDHGGA
jgi:hypothetical protein